MRGPISQRRNYAAGVQIGQVMTGGGMGEAVASRHPDFASGDIVESFTFGWRDYAVLGPGGMRRIDPGLGPIHSAPAPSARRGSRPISRSLEVVRARPDRSGLAASVQEPKPGMT